MATSHWRLRPIREPHMFKYNLKLALKSMRRNPTMTGLMVAAIAVGIGVSMTTLTVHGPHLKTLMEETAPQVAELLVRDEVDAVFLTPA